MTAHVSCVLLSKCTIILHGAVMDVHGCPVSSVGRARENNLNSRDIGSIPMPGFQTASSVLNPMCPLWKAVGALDAHGR